MLEATVRRSLFSAIIAVAAFSWPESGAAQDAAARRLYQEAQRLLQAGDVTGAAGELGILVQQFPADALAARALLDLVEIRRVSGDLSGAEVALKKILADYPRTIEAASAFVTQGQMQFEAARSPADLEAARTTFRRVALLFGQEAFPRLEARIRARLRSGEMSLLLGDRAGALAEFLGAIEDEPANSSRGRAKLLLGRTLLATDQWASALQLLQELIDEEPKPGTNENAALATSSARDRAQARRLTSLAHRHLVRPAAGMPRWTKAGRLPIAGVALREPEGVAAAEDGQVLVTDLRAQIAILLDESGQVLGQRPIADATHPAFSQGIAHVVAESQVLLPFEGRSSTTFLQPKGNKEAPLKGMRAAVRGPFGQWFILAKSFDGLLEYETERLGTETMTNLQAELVDLAQDTLGRLHLLDAKANKVIRLAVDRRTSISVAQGAWKKPAALAVDTLGFLYVLDRGPRQIEIFDPAGKLVGVVGPTLGPGIELKDPQDVAIDGSGRLLISDRKQATVWVLE